MSLHLFVDISAHGFGHLAQTAPVLNALRQRLPGLRLTIRSLLPREQLNHKLSSPFRHIHKASDFGLCMHNAVDVDLAASLQRYENLHADWTEHVENYAAELRAERPDLLLSNVSYLALAAAHLAQIPAVAMCSLNWHDIFHPYLNPRHSQYAILQQMLDSYNSAHAFLRLSPGMVMPALRNLISIGPIAERGEAQKERLRTSLHLEPQTKIVLLAMGGMHMPLPQQWPSLPQLVWIMPQQIALSRPDVFVMESVGMRFSDLLASCDAVITKSGYGVFTEATLVGTPVLYLERPDWPEQPCLVEWLQAHNHARLMTRAAYESGAFIDNLQDLLTLPCAPGMMPTGIATASDYLLEKLL